MDKSSSFIRSTAKRTMHFQINLLGLQQMQQPKFDVKVSKDPVAAKTILWKLLGSKMTLETYSSIGQPRDLEGLHFCNNGTGFKHASDSEERQ